MSSSAPVLLIALDDVVTDVGSGLRYVAKEVAEGFAGREELIPGIHAKRDAVDGALAAVRRLIASERYAVWLVAAVPVGNPSAAAGTVDWVVRHLGDAVAARLVLAADWARLRGDLLVATEARGFGGEWVRFAGWEAALVRLLG